MDFRARHLLQVLQVGVEEVAAGQRNPQNPLDDVPDGAVVWETDLLCCVHEVTTAGKIKGHRGSEWMRELSTILIFENETGGSPGPRAHLQGQTPTHTEPCSSSSKPEVYWFL